ncbi:hypothetical protein GJ629_07030 [Halapricum sp. CBA1109]|uniref:hypothetical protein n=1 Tax=Halapricum sp. CBA1109 TaxID=2668068 RepID=UPI0012FAB5DC|nr:hypothetical protein [Halapricum sp. CBA1109]MUV89678.1 hypothetical protein [Halapricum sp. CBA1109]
MGSEDGAAGFVESVPAVESAELVSAGPLYKYRGSMANGPDDVWFWTVDPASVDDDAVTAAFEDRVGEWAAIDDARYVASVAAYDTEPRPWVAVLAAESTVGSMDHSLSRRQCRAVVDGVTRALQAAADAGVTHYTLSPDHVHASRTANRRQSSPTGGWRPPSPRPPAASERPRRTTHPSRCTGTIRRRRRRCTDSAQCPTTR